MGDGFMDWMGDELVPYPWAAVPCRACGERELAGDRGRGRPTWFVCMACGADQRIPLEPAGAVAAVDAVFEIGLSGQPVLWSSRSRYGQGTIAQYAGVADRIAGSQPEFAILDEARQLEVEPAPRSLIATVVEMARAGALRELTGHRRPAFAPLVEAQWRLHYEGVGAVDPDPEPGWLSRWAARVRRVLGGHR